MAFRKLFPWERDVFEVCLEGPCMDIRTINAASSYNVKFAQGDLNPSKALPEREPNLSNCSAKYFVKCSLRRKGSTDKISMR